MSDNVSLGRSANFNEILLTAQRLTTLPLRAFSECMRPRSSVSPPRPQASASDHSLFMLFQEMDATLSTQTGLNTMIQDFTLAIQETLDDDWTEGLLMSRFQMLNRY